MARRRNLREWLESSPWVVLAGLIAAILTFLLNVGEQGWRLYERITAKAPLPAIEVTAQRGYFLIRPTPEMLKLEVVQQVLSAEKSLTEILRPRPLTGRVPVWPVQLLVLNPTREKLNLHSCRMFVRAEPEIKMAISFGYFVSDTIDLKADDEERLFVVEPEGARQVQLMFVFAGLPEAPRTKFDLFKPGYLDVSCRDQTRREIRTTYPIYSTLRAADGK
jgi:hypothetical protein